MTTFPVGPVETVRYTCTMAIQKCSRATKSFF